MKILVATDGSEHSDAAVEECCRIIARAQETQVKVISTYKKVLPIDNFPESSDYALELEKQERELCETYVGKAVERINECHPESGIETFALVLPGSADQSIIEAAEEWNADLIVIGSHGSGFWSRTLVGSVSDSVIHHAPCSVLVVRKKDSETNEQ
jgi:nucleotide-binding universal stress UspA family protein